jgi:hypothetical protein
MIHELIGIAYNRVDLRGVAGVKPELAEAVLSAHADPFFRENMHANFGDVGMAIKRLVDSWSRESRVARDFQSIEDMASFIEGLPEYSVQAGATYKHVTVRAGGGGGCVCGSGTKRDQHVQSGLLPRANISGRRWQLPSPPLNPNSPFSNPAPRRNAPLSTPPPAPDPPLPPRR